MGRVRFIKPEFFLDEELCEHPFHVRLAFAGLWVHADREGRMEDRPRYLKSQIFPYDKIDFDAILSVLSMHSKFITRYASNGKHYIQINNFKKHQRPHHTEKESEIPAPDIHGDLTVNSPLLDGENPPDYGLRITGKDMCDSGESHDPSLKKKSPRRTDYTPEFTSFWSEYPKRVEKQVAFEAWKAAAKEYPPGDIIRAAKEYAEECEKKGMEEQFIKHPGTFLRKGRWKDYCFEEDVINK